MEGIFCKNSEALWKFQLNFILFFNFWVLLETPNPPSPGNSNAFCGGNMDIFWNCTVHGVKYTNNWCIFIVELIQYYIWDPSGVFSISSLG